MARLRIALPMIAVLTAAVIACSGETANTHEEPTSTPVLAPANKWVIRESKDAITDEHEIVLSLTAQDGVSRFGERPTLKLRCEGNALDALISWGDYINNESIPVVTRFDSDPPRNSVWNIATDGTATFWRETTFTESVEGRTVISRVKTADFINHLGTATTFTARVEPFNESPLTAIWKVSGLVEIWQPLKDQCQF